MMTPQTFEERLNGLTHEETKELCRFYRTKIALSTKRWSWHKRLTETAFHIIKMQKVLREKEAAYQKFVNDIRKDVIDTGVFGYSTISIHYKKLEEQLITIGEEKNEKEFSSKS